MREPPNAAWMRISWEGPCDACAVRRTARSPLGPAPAPLHLQPTTAGTHLVHAMVLLVMVASIAVPWLGLSWLAVALVLAHLAVIRVGLVMLREVPSRAERIVHGLEHATITLLAARRIAVMFAHSHEDHFVLDIPEPPARDELEPAVRAACDEGIRRIRAGEHALAFHPCGARSYVVGMLQAGVATVSPIAWLCGAAPWLASGIAVAAAAVAWAAIAPLTTRVLRREVCVELDPAVAVAGVEVREVPEARGVQVGVLIATGTAADAASSVSPAPVLRWPPIRSRWPPSRSR